VPKILKARPPHDDGEERKIRKLAGARHAPADWTQRAQIITLSWDGLAVPAIAGQLGCHPKKARRWLHRFNAAGLDGLGDRPGAGRRRITEAQRSAIIALARSEPPGRLARDAAGELSAEDEDGPAQWTLDTLARAAREAGIQVGRGQVRRILRAEKVRWRRTRSWAVSTDPEFAPKGPASWSSAPPRRPVPRWSAPAYAGTATMPMCWLCVLVVKELGWSWLGIVTGPRGTRASCRSDGSGRVLLSRGW
jgi:transposase